MMKIPSPTAFASLALLGVLGSLPFACAASLDDRCSEGACAARDGGGGGDVVIVEAGSDGPPTDPCIAKPTDPTCLDESKALFVSGSTGNDQTGLGTRDKPLKSITTALTKIDTAKRRIYVCTGAYPEDLSLNSTHAGVSIFGGLDCAWGPAPGGMKPVIGAGSNPFKVDGTQGLALADLAIEAKDTTTGSSIALFVRGGDTTLRGVRLKAGRGGTGADGVPVPFTDFPVQADLDGNASPNTSTGGPQKVVTCPGGAQTKGGAGGNPAAPGSGTPGPANAGATFPCSGAETTGKPGANATNAAGATVPGVLDATGWLPSSGSKGDNGGPGQGGGGGFPNLGGGGGGGAGGCGGAGGPGGGGGGASIALASVTAKVTLTASELIAGDGGAGGKGALAQDGQTIYGFGGAATGGACQGGLGGNGGNGGAGGGGIGGSSFGIAYKGPKPTTDPPTDSATSTGAKGTGGQLAGTNPGADGAAAALFEAK